MAAPSADAAAALATNTGVATITTGNNNSNLDESSQQQPQQPLPPPVISVSEEQAENGGAPRTEAASQAPAVPNSAPPTEVNPGSTEGPAGLPAVGLQPPAQTPLRTKSPASRPSPRNILTKPRFEPTIQTRMQASPRMAASPHTKALLKHRLGVDLEGSPRGSPVARLRKESPANSPRLGSPRVGSPSVASPRTPKMFSPFAKGKNRVGCLLLQTLKNSMHRVECICSVKEDQGFMLQCEQCYCWQHGRCVQIKQENEPAEYYCTECRAENDAMIQSGVSFEPGEVPPVKRRRTQLQDAMPCKTPIGRGIQRAPAPAVMAAAAAVAAAAETVPPLSSPPVALPPPDDLVQTAAVAPAQAQLASQAVQPRPPMQVPAQVPPQATHAPAPIQAGPIQPPGLRPPPAQVLAPPTSTVAQMAPLLHLAAQMGPGLLPGVHQPPYPPHPHPLLSIPPMGVQVSLPAPTPPIVPTTASTLPVAPPGAPGAPLEPPH